MIEGVAWILAAAAITAIAYSTDKMGANGSTTHTASVVTMAVLLSGAVALDWYLGVWELGYTAYNMVAGFIFHRRHYRREKDAWQV